MKVTAQEALNSYEGIEPSNDDVSLVAQIQDTANDASISPIKRLNSIKILIHSLKLYRLNTKYFYDQIYDIMGQTAKTLPISKKLFLINDLCDKFLKT